MSSVLSNEKEGLVRRQLPKVERNLGKRRNKLKQGRKWKQVNECFAGNWQLWLWVIRKEHNVDRRLMELSHHLSNAVWRMLDTSRQVLLRHATRVMWKFRKFQKKLVDDEMSFKFRLSFPADGCE